MAKNKNAGFVNAANKLVEDVFQRRAAEEANAASDPRRDEAMMALALTTGDFSRSPAAQQALNTYNQLMAEGIEMAKASGLKPDSQDYKDFTQYYTYMMWPQDSPISYDDFYNANSKRLETSKAKGLEAQRKASDKRVANFSEAMQQIDPVTGSPYSELTTQSALDDARQSWDRFSGAISGAANEGKNNYTAYNQYRKDNNLRWWENADGFTPPNG